MLEHFGGIFLEGTVAPGVNLLRKRFTTAVVDMRSNPHVLAMLKVVDKHSAQVTLSHYLRLTFEQQADQARLIYFAAMGEPPAWPSEEELLDEAQPQPQAEEDEEAEAAEDKNHWAYEDIHEHLRRHRSITDAIYEGDCFRSLD